MRRTGQSAIKAVPLKTLSVRATPLLLIIFALTLIGFHRMGVLPVEKLRVSVTDVMAPVLSAASQPFVTAANSFEGVRTLRTLRAENIRLREENARLMQWYEAALKFQSENNSLHDLLNVKADTALSFVTTRVVSDPGGAFVKSFLLPVGMSDNVYKGNAVMSGRGLIGRITETGQHSARVLLVTDLNSRIPVVIQNTRTKAILSGRNDDILYLERLPPDSGLTLGSRVMTSGDGGILPPDIPVGTIVSMSEKGVLVKPLADVGRVTWVQVVNTDMDKSLVTGDIH